MPSASPTITGSRSRKFSTASIAAKSARPRSSSPPKKTPCASRKSTGVLPWQMHPHFDFAFARSIVPHEADAGPQSRIVAVGHFGNFELYARFGQFVPVFKCAATYRALKQPALNRIMVALRQTSDCRFFERRTDAAALKAAMSDTGLLLGLLADQHAGRNGLRLPFLGHDCSTSAAPAIFALRYHCPLHTSICYRVGLARWRIEAGAEIPVHENGQPRSTRAIMLDVNRAFEAAIRRDPANWFWVHNRWKPPPPGRGVTREFTAAKDLSTAKIPGA